MTQTLDWRGAMGEAPVDRCSPGARTLGLETVLGQVAMAPLQRSQVHNVLLRARGSDAPAWRARAAFDRSRRCLVSLMLAPANGGRPVEADLVAKLVERSLAFVEEQRDAATERFLAVAEPTDADHDGSVLDADALESVRQIALTCFPVGSMVDGSDDADESGVPLKLMTVVSPAPADVTHEAYLGFMRAWVRLEPPQRRRRVRVSFRSGARG